MIERAEFPVQRNKTLKGRGMVIFRRGARSCQSDVSVLRLHAHARPGEMGAEAAALPRRARDLERGAVPAQRVLHDREPQSRAAAFARAAAIDAIEALGEARDVLGGDADAGVLDFERRSVRRLAPREAHRAALG